MDGQPMPQMQADSRGNALFYCMLEASSNDCDCEVCKVLREHVAAIKKDMRPEVGHGRKARKREG